MSDMTLEAVEAQRADEVLTPVALNTPVQGFVADLIFPPSDPGPSTIEIPDWGTQENQTLVGTLRSADSTEVPTFSLEARSIGTYKLEAHWGQHKVDGLMEAVANERVIFKRMSYEARKTRVLINRWRTTKEKFAAAVMASPQVFDVNNSLALAGAAKWSDDASDPVTVIFNKSLEMTKLTGFAPNGIFIPRPVLNRCALHPKVIARLGANAVSPLTDDQLRVILRMEHMIVPSGIANNAGPKKPKNMDWIWPGDEVILFYKAPFLTEDTRSFTAKFIWDTVPALIAYRAQLDPDFYAIRFSEVLKYAVLDRFCGFKWTAVL